MKIKDILKIEQENNSSIFLHKEGLFWRAYERSAYLFTLYIKVYQITKKFYKNVNSEIIYLGFPNNSLEQILQTVNEKNVQKNEKQIIINNYQFDISQFISWKNKISIIKNSKNPETFEKFQQPENNIFKKIRNYPIASKTPIECQQFLIEIQKEINGTLH